jgi:hypothetical protein
MSNNVLTSIFKADRKKGAQNGEKSARSFTICILCPKLLGLLNEDGKDAVYIHALNENAYNILVGKAQESDRLE